MGLWGKLDLKISLSDPGGVLSLDLRDLIYNREYIPMAVA